MVAVMAADDEESIFRGSTPLQSFKRNSPNNNPWDDSMTAGAFIGFIIFGISYVYVVISIFYDINKSKHEYMELIEEDLAIIQQLNISQNMKEEWANDLVLRIEGKVKDENLDDQLFGAAATMPESEYKEFM